MAQDTQSRIQQIALELFAQRGYHATTMRSIAQSANLQTASLYHWYPNKEALLVGLIERFLDELNREVVRAIADEVDPVRRLAAAIRAHVIYHGHERLAAVVTDTELRALGDEPRRHVVAMRDAYQERFAGLVQACIDDGAVHVRSRDVATYALLLLATSVDVWFRPDGPLSIEQVADLHVELALGALRTEPERLDGAIGG